VDPSGGEDSTTAEITPVNNVPPQWTVSFNPSNRHVSVGANLTITVTETQSLDGDHIDRYSYDCDSDGTWEAEDVASNTYNCTYASAGTYYVKVRIKDTGGSVDEKGGNGVAGFDVVVSAGGGSSTSTWTAVKEDNNGTDEETYYVYHGIIPVPSGYLFLYYDSSDNRYVVYDAEGNEVTSDVFSHDNANYQVTAVFPLSDDPLPDGSTTHGSYFLAGFTPVVGTDGVIELRDASNIGGNGDELLDITLSDFRLYSLCGFLPTYDPSDSNKILYRVVAGGKIASANNAAFYLITLSYDLTSGNWLVLGAQVKDIGFGGEVDGCFTVRNFSSGRALYLVGTDTDNNKAFVYKYLYRDLVDDLSTASAVATYEVLPTGAASAVFMDGYGIGVDADGDFEKIVVVGGKNVGGSYYGLLQVLNSQLDTVQLSYEDPNESTFREVVPTSDPYKVVVAGHNGTPESVARLYDISSSTATLLYDYVANDSDKRLHGDTGDDYLVGVLYTGYGTLLFLGTTASTDFDPTEFSGGTNADKDLFVTQLPLYP
jgi:hypothetical protein